MCGFTWYIECLIVCCMRVLCAVVDMWSVGCIFGEVIRGTVLFPGTDRILTVCLFSNPLCCLLSYFACQIGSNTLYLYTRLFKSLGPVRVFVCVCILCRPILYLMLNYLTKNTVKTKKNIYI